MAENKTTALAPAQQSKDIKLLVQSDQFRKAVAAALPKHLTPERFIRVALNALMRQPELLNCTQESFFRCMLDLSAYGLEPDGRRAHLIPFGKACTLIIDYKGLAELVRRSGDVSYIHADVVYSEDDFDFSYGTNAHLKHIPLFEGDRGQPFCVYSFVRLKDGSEDFMVMSMEEVDEIRKISKAKDSGPWKTFPLEMSKKTVFRRHSKWLPLSPEVKDVIDHDDDYVIDANSIDIGERMRGSQEEADKVVVKKLAFELGYSEAQIAKHLNAPDLIEALRAEYGIPGEAKPQSNGAPKTEAKEEAKSVIETAEEEPAEASVKQSGSVKQFRFGQ